MMKEFKLKFPWCTGVPRPTIIENIDEEECIVVFNTAPIVKTSVTAALVFNGFKSIKHSYINDLENPYLKKGYLRDSLIKEGKTFILLFHNELIEIEAVSYKEQEANFKSAEEVLKIIKNKYA